MSMCMILYILKVARKPLFFTISLNALKTQPISAKENDHFVLLAHAAAVDGRKIII